MSGFDRIKEEKKARIREAAFKLFTENGYKSVKISDIAGAADVSQVTIYNHFESKEALFRDMVIRIIKDAYLKYEEISNSDKTFREKLESLFLMKMENAKQLNPEMWQRILVDDPLLIDYVQKYTKEKALPLFINLINEGKRTGEVNQNYSTDTILFYINMLENEAIRHPDAFYNDNFLNLAEDLNNLFLYGLIGKPKK